MAHKTLVMTLVVLAAVLLVPILNVLGVFDLGWMDNVTMGMFGFAWVVALVLALGELTFVAAGISRA